MSLSNPLKTRHIAEYIPAVRQLYTGSGARYTAARVAIQDNPVRFGVFELRRETRELRKHGIRIKLEDQPFSVLLALLENPGAIVTRDDLRGRIWPAGTFVDFDKSLTKAINKIRTALNDSATTPRFIETLSRRGYRFIAPVIGADQAVAEPAAPAPPPSRRKWPLVLASLLALMAAVTGFNLGGVRNRWLASPDAAPIRSLTVLPIVNLTGDPTKEYFADGLTDDLISDLSRIGSVRVVSYTSAMRYKGVRKALPEIGRELGVEGIIEGSVQRGADRVRMNVKLVRAAVDRQVWSESYEGELAEAARLEGRVALAVAHQISAHLTAETTARLTGRGPANPRAYDAYLHGRYLWNLRGRDAVTQAGGYFEQAVREDPRFALAWSGLADRYTIGWNAGSNFDLAETYARKAVALDPSLSEAHVSLGFALECQFRFAEAEAELKRGIQLNPNYVPGRQLHAIYLLTVGRPVEALAESDYALQLDPFSLPVNNMRGYILIGLRQYDRAAEYLRTAVAIDPRSEGPHVQLARLYWIQQRVPEALAEERIVASMETGPGAEAILLGRREVEAAYAKSGFREACLRSAGLKERAAGGEIGWLLPLQYGLLRDKRKVLELLNRQVSARGYNQVILFETSPEYDFLRSDPAFQDLLRRVGLPR